MLCQVSAASSIPAPAACVESRAAPLQQHPQPTPHWSLDSKVNKIINSPLKQADLKHQLQSSASGEAVSFLQVLIQRVLSVLVLKSKLERHPYTKLHPLFGAKVLVGACCAATQSSDEYSCNPPNCFYPQQQPQRSLTWKGEGRRYKGTSILPPTPLLPPYSQIGGYSP